MTALVSIRDLTIAFERKGGVSDVLQRVNLAVPKGQIVALVGESGSGKTITALSIMRLLASPPAIYRSGEILLDGQDLLKLPEPELRKLRGKTMTMVFQEPMTALNPLHTIGRQIEEMIAIHHPSLTREQRKARMLEVMEKVGLSQFADRLSSYPHQLSGGERQRVLIAMAIANDPRLLIADEPTTALDVTIQQQIVALLKELKQTLDTTVLLITHDLSVVHRLADHMVVMKDGAVVENGPVDTVLRAPKHAYTKMLIASQPSGRPKPVAANAPMVLEAEHIRVYFPIRKGVFQKTVDHKKAVDDISLSLRKGETLGIVGESGSGKSTLALALLRLIASTGAMRFQGKDLRALDGKALRALRPQMQMVFQDPFSSLNPRLRIVDIVGEGIREHVARDPAVIRGRVEETLVEVGLKPEFMERYPHELSGGQRQRVSIARALVLNPELVVLDEPTSALDVATQAQIVALLRKLQEDRGLSYLFISHDLRVVRALSHRILVMRQGRVVEAGATEALFAKPASEYTRALMEAAFPEGLDA